MSDKVVEKLVHTILILVLIYMVCQSTLVITRMVFPQYYASQSVKILCEKGYFSER